ncbi:MAG: hypothetical protein EXR66_03920 [Dehalococcoidia bacterium]|nr:hypothetical protein [Dehalococcoidia bacterium]
MPHQVTPARRGRATPSASRTWRLTAAATLLSLLSLMGCRQEVSPAHQTGLEFTPLPRVIVGEPRSYLLGFSSLPTRPTIAGYTSAMDLAANYGEVLLIQREPAWSSFLPGASVANELERTTLSERGALADRHLQLMYAIDVFDPASRGRLAGLPTRFEGQTLANPELRRALVQQARFVALNYRPTFLALGVEVNAAFEANPQAYEAYREAYAEAYAEVKAASPTTLVFPTFQYEQLLGLISWEPPHAPRWRLIEEYQGQMDLFAITTYPSFVYQSARKVPSEYYSDARAHTSLPIAFASAGFASDVTREGLNSSTPPEQRRYLQRLLADANALSSPLVIWFAGRDPANADSAPSDLIGSIGLRTSDDRAKDAWPAWEQAVNRPYAGQLPGVERRPP